MTRGNLGPDDPMTDLAEFFGLDPGAPRLLEALCHPSYANETRSGATYQRLEFLGDAVLELCASELLWRHFPEADEGSLTRLRAQLVNADALGTWAREHGVAEAVRLGRGAEANGLRQSTSVLSDVVEALIGAVFVDHGLDAARRVCGAILGPKVAGFEIGDGLDPKSALQERVQKDGGALPVYDIVESGGPAHEPWYAVTVSVQGRVLGTGRGRSKRLAERAAARAALETLEGGRSEGGGA
jgi:ribonuclease III